MSIRIQIVVHGKLVAEAVVKDMQSADNLWFRWCKLRDKRNKPMGGAGMNDVRFPKFWNVPVGSDVNS